MPIALTEEHRQLADSVAGFAGRHLRIEQTRASFDELAAGGRPPFWDALLGQGLHALHLPEKADGTGAGLPELAIVVEQLGRALCPGPFLPTVLASAVLCGGDVTDPRTAELLAQFAAGATGALVTGAGLVAVPDGAGWVVDGATGPVLGLPGAELVIVAAEVVAAEVVAAEVEGAQVAGAGAAGAGPRLWFALDGSGAQIVALQPTDLTRSVGRLTLRGHRVAAGQALAAIPAERAELVVATLLAAEAAGLSRWGLSTAVDYVKTREQFGQAVGRFQAVQHKAAMLLVRTELATAAAWDAARAESADAAQQRIAAAQAVLAALPAGVDNALETITLLGGIGFTWEHDAHLYQRRALSIAAIAGTEDAWAERLGQLALTGPDRDFSFVGPHALPELRAQVRAALAEAAALPDDGERSDGWAATRGGRRQARLARAGLVCPHYPPPYGLAAGPAEQAVINQEFADSGVRQPTIIIGEWVLPTLLVHGSAEQQQRFVEPTLRGEILWCQLFSEPGAGSDLASLRTRATKVQDGWRLTGQKVWTSMAHQAEWGVCLARTDPDAPKHKGISYFLLDMSAPGLQVRPLRQSTGRSEFNEVFLDGVFVADDCLVGAPNDGWRLAVTTLSNERLSIGSNLSHGGARRIRDLVTSGRLAGPREDAVRALGRCTSRELALSALNLRGVLARLSATEPGAEISVQKVYNALAQRAGSRELVRLLGSAGAAIDPSVELDDVVDHLSLPAILFGGGTVEIQLNVIAQRVLGLPR